MAQSRRADHHPGGAYRHRFLDRLEGSKSARQVDPHRRTESGDERSHGHAMHGPTASRSVQIDDVQPRRSSTRERRGDGERICRERRLSIEVPLFEPDDATSDQVDRRQELEFACQSPSLRVSVLLRYNVTTTAGHFGATARRRDDEAMPGANLGPRLAAFGSHRHMVDDWKTYDAGAP